MGSVSAVWIGHWLYQAGNYVTENLTAMIYQMNVCAHRNQHCAIKYV